MCQHGKGINGARELTAATEAMAAMVTKGSKGQGWQLDSVGSNGDSNSGRR